VVFLIDLPATALELKQVFEQIAQAEKSGASPEERKKLEEQAAEKVCPPHETSLRILTDMSC
jgi:spore maturation protein CgeB